MIESSSPKSQFQTVSNGVYWAIVTMTTVGYGDVVPQTALGRLLASVVMMMGFGIIAIPTGILTVSGVRQGKRTADQTALSSRQGHREDARHCDQCGACPPASDRQGLNGCRRGILLGLLARTAVTFSNNLVAHCTLL